MVTKPICQKQFIIDLSKRDEPISERMCSKKVIAAERDEAEAKGEISMEFREKTICNLSNFARKGKALTKVHGLPNVIFNLYGSV